MCKECHEHKEYKSFDELPLELKELYKGGKTKQCKDGYVDFINKLNKKGDKLVSDYVNANTKVRIHYGKCGHTHPEEEGVTPSNYKGGRGCGICNGKIVVKEVNDLATKRPDLAKEWHPTKNGDLQPTQVSFGSGKKVWWQCEHGHEWEVGIGQRTSYNTNCPYCSNHRVLKGYNDIATTHPQYVKYFVNIEDAYTHTYSSEAKAEMKCPICGAIKVMSIAQLVHYGFGCSKCSDGTSYPNKVMALVVETLGLNYELEYIVEGYSQYKYDIYLIDYKQAIENDGGQHYAYLDDKLKDKKIWNNKTGMEIHYIDLGKESILMREGLGLIVIDCKESNIDYIRNSVENHPFFQQFDLSNIDWKEIDIQAQKSKKVEVCRYWKEQKETCEDLTTTIMAEMFNVSNITIIDWLKWGNKNGFCTYSGEEERKASKRRQSKFVYLIKPDGTKWYDKAVSQHELFKLTGISENVISLHREDGKPIKGNSKYKGCYIIEAK